MLEDVWIFGTVRESITTSPPDHRCRFAADNDDTTIRRHDGAFGAGTKCTKSTSHKEDPGISSTDYLSVVGDIWLVALVSFVLFVAFVPWAPKAPT